MNKVLLSISDFFTEPKVWQRVIVFGALMFFVAYELSSDKTLHKPIEMSEAAFFVVAILLWSFFAGTKDIKDYTRVFLGGVYGSLFYAVTLLGASAGTSAGWVLYWQVVAYLSIGLVSLFSITGQGPNELFQLYRDTQSVKQTTPYIASNVKIDSDSSSSNAG